MSTLIIKDEDFDELIEVKRVVETLKPYLELTVESIDDKEGIAKVHAAWKEVRSVRIGLEKSRVELKAPGLAYCNRVDSLSGEAKGMLDPIEAHLKHQKDIIKREEERLAKIEAEKKQAMIDARLDALAAVGVSFNPLIAERMTDDEFEAELSKATEAHEAKLKAEADERERLAAEAKALEIERAELEAQRKANELAERERREKAEAEAAALRAEMAERKAAEDKIEAERAEKARLDQEKIDAERAELEREKQKIADEKAAAELKETQKREAAEREERKRIEAERLAEQQRLTAERLAAEREALQPDVVKLEAFAAALKKVKRPAMKTDSGKSIQNAANSQLDSLIELLLEFVEDNAQTENVAS